MPRFASTVALVCLTAVLSCGGATQNDGESARPLRVAIDLWPGYYPIFLADELGYFREEGVDVEIHTPEDTDAMLADFAANTYDGVAVALGDIINVTRAAPDVRVVLVTDESSGGDGIVGRKPFKSMSDLKGLEIGTNLGGFGELFVREFLKRQGLGAEDVQLTNVEAAKVPELLATGAIDAGHTWQPYLGQAQEMGGSIWFSSRETPGLIPDVLAFRKSVIDGRRDEMKAFVRAWFRAVEYWKADNRRGCEMIAKKLACRPSDISLEGIRLLGREENRVSFDSGGGKHSLHEIARRYVEFFVARGTLSIGPSTTDLLDESLL